MPSRLSALFEMTMMMDPSDDALTGTTVLKALKEKKEHACGRFHCCNKLQSLLPVHEKQPF